MSENKNSQEYDFYQAALKAFDVPAITASEEKAAALEAPAELEIIQPLEETPKPTRSKRLWMVILLVAVFVLMVSLWPKRYNNHANRGEYWVYGDVVAVEEDHVVLIDMDNKRWYVDTTGVELPKMYLHITGSLNGGAYEPFYGNWWIYYDGEPQPTTDAACSWKVTATVVLDSVSYVVDGSKSFGRVFDDLLFDLDGDGKLEQWLLFDKMDCQRLFVLTQDGNVKHDVLLQSSIAESSKFHPKDNQLQLAAIGALSSVNLDVKLEDGTLAVYYGKTKLNVVDQLRPTVPTVPTTPPTTTSQRIDKDAICSIQFFLGKVASNLAMSVEPAEMENIYFDFLEALSWKDIVDEEIVETAGYFIVRIGNDYHAYHFTNDDTLIYKHNGKAERRTQLSADDWNRIMELMYRSAPTGINADSHYIGADSAGRSLDIYLNDGGSAQLIYSELYADVTYPMLLGKFAMISDYLYIRNTIVEAKPFVFVFRKVNDEFVYVAELSEHEMMKISDGQIFGDPYAPKELYVTISATDPQTGELLVGDFPKITLSESQSDSLKKLLSEVEWLDADMGETVPACRFVLQYANGIGEAFGICGTELWRSRGLAKLSLTQWKTLMNIIGAAQGNVLLHGDYSADLGGINYQLSFGQGRTFEITFGYEVGAHITKGRYIASGGLVYIWNEAGNTYLLISRANGFDVVQETSNGLPDGLQFRKNLNFTTLSYDIIVDEMSGLYAEDLSDQVSSRLSDIVTNLQWQPVGTDPQGVMLGAISMWGDADWFGADIRSDRTLVGGDMEAKLSEEDWNFLLNLLADRGKPGPSGVYTAAVGEKTLELCIMGAEFKIIDGENWIVGKCVCFDKTLMLFGDDGQVLVLSANQNGTLRYHSRLSWLTTWELSSDTKFQPL